MKKLRLLLALLALVGVNLTANAQTDAEYAAANAEIQANGVYKIYTFSDGSSIGETKYYLKSDGYLTEDASAAGQFTFDFQRIFGGFKLGGYRINQFTNGGASDNTFSGDALKKIVTTGQNRKDWEAQVFFKGDDGYAVRSTNATSTSWGASAFWTVVEDNDDDGLPNATYTVNAVPYVWQLEKVTDGDFSDVTSKWIVNYEPNSSDKEAGWTVTPGSSLGAWDGHNFSNEVAEFYRRSDGGISQTIQSLPAGYYTFTAIASARENSGGTISVNGISKGILSLDINSTSEANTQFKNGNGVNTIDFSLDQTSDVTIALTAGNAGDAWTVYRAFYLSCNNGPAALRKALAAAKETANAALDNESYSKVTGYERTQLSASVDKSIDESGKTPSILNTEYNALIDEVNEKTTAFTEAVTYYDLYDSELALANVISNTIPDEDLTPATVGAKAAFQALKVAEYNYVKEAYPYSATSKIGEFSTWTRTGTVNGNTKNEFEALTSQHWSGTEMTYYEQPATGWNNSAWTANYTKTTILPAGNYVVKVAARAATGTATTAKITCSATTTDGPIPNLGDTGKGITTDGVASFDEGTFANEGKGRGWVWNYLPFTLEDETEVTMTVVAEATGVRQWFSVADGELLSMTNIATPVTYVDAEENTIEDVDVANVTISRTIKADYNTVVLPFDLTASQVAAAFGTGTEVYAFSEDSANPMDATINFNKVVAGTISANVPVLVKATQGSSEQVFNGVQVVAAQSAIVEGKNFDFVGTYAPITVAEGDYFIGNGALYKSAGATSMKAFRAYINAKTTATGAKVNLFIDGIATSIREINGATANESGDVFNIVGQRVKKAQKGLYIINGKKVLVK